MKREYRSAVAAFLLMACVAGPAGCNSEQPGDAPAAQAASAPTAGALRLGDRAPDFTLATRDGKSVRLSDQLDGQHFVVVMWYSPACPCVANCLGSLFQHMKPSDYQDVRFVGVMSDSQLDEPYMIADSKKQADDGLVTFPVLLDRDRAIEKLYGAKRTPTVWVLDKGGVIRFWGAPESTLEPTLEEHRFLLKEAIDALRKGEPPKTQTFEPIGCPIS